MADLVLTVETGGAVMRFEAPRQMLMLRASELYQAGGRRFIYKLDGEVITPPGANENNQTVEPLEDGAIDCEAVEVDAVAVSRNEHRSPSTPKKVLESDRVLTLADAARLSNELLEKAAAIRESMLDRAASRTEQQFEVMSRHQAEQARRQMDEAAKLQTFVSSMNAKLAEERVSAFQFSQSQQALDRAEQQREYMRQLALAEANRPSVGLVLTELLVGFAGHFATNAQRNFAVMNGQPQPKPES